MKSTISTLIFFFVFSFFSLAQQYERVWVKQYQDNAADNHYFNDMVVDKYGNTYTAGYESNWSNYQLTHFYIKKVSSDGKPLWKRYFNNLKDSMDEAIAIATDADGFIYVTGTRKDSATYGTTVSDIVTMKYDSSGKRIWLNRFHDAAFVLASPKDISISPGGSILITGNETRYVYEMGAYINNLLLLKLDKAGKTLWTKKMDQVVGHGGCFDNMNNIIIAGASDPGNLPQTQKPMVLKFKPNGSLAWSNVFNEYNKNGRFYYVECDLLNNIYINGQTDTISFYNNPRILTVKYNKAGKQLWFSKEVSGSFTMPSLYGAFTIDAKGNCYVAGTLNYSDVNSKRIITKYTTGGVKKWTDTFNTGFWGPDRPTGIVVDQQQNVIVTGTCYYQNNRHVAITNGYNKNGTPFFTDVYELNSIENMVTLGIQKDPADNLYVAGRSTIVIKYGIAQAAASATASGPASENLILFPNPARDVLHIGFVAPAGASAYRVVITDVSGNRALVKQLGKFEGKANLAINIEQLKPGIYTMVITDGVTSFTRKFIKKE